MFVNREHKLKFLNSAYAQKKPRMTDPFFRFWFRFVFPNFSSLEEGMIDYVLGKKIKPHFDEFVSWAYEQIALDLLRNLVRVREDFLFERFGRWWDRNEEIDLVALNESEKRILFGEVKWSRNKVGINILEDLKRKAALVPWHQRGRQEQFALVSRSGFTPALMEEAKKRNVLLIEGTEVLE